MGLLARQGDTAGHCRSLAMFSVLSVLQMFSSRSLRRNWRRRQGMRRRRGRHSRHGLNEGHAIWDDLGRPDDQFVVGYAVMVTAHERLV